MIKPTHFEDTRRPAWLRKKRNLTGSVLSTMSDVRKHGLHTVCESARCPNLAECYSRGIATVMILGNSCTRNCLFCAVNHGPPMEPDRNEGCRIARYAEQKDLRYLVITSVTRDDLTDGGASHFVSVVRAIRDILPQLKIEVLVPDFKGSGQAIREVAHSPIEVFGHNMETVRNLYPTVRPLADYGRSLEVLRVAKESGSPNLRVKTGIMIGLGETAGELADFFSDLASIEPDILTIGQYLRPSKKHLPVKRYYKPIEFHNLEKMAKEAGILSVQAGPYVRSSYLAESSYLDGLRNCQSGSAETGARFLG